MKLNSTPTSLNIKLVLLVLALAIASGTVFYTQDLVEKLQQKEKQIVQLYADGFEYIVNTDLTDSDLTFIFTNVIQRIDFPLILTDKDDNVNLSGNSNGLRNLEIDSTLTENEIKEFLQEEIRELAKINPPIEVTHSDSIILAKIYYGDSDLIKRLKYYPYLQIIFAILFIIIFYVSFSHVKKTEQSNIWVGMSKETAHQLGTPISSLMGWSEMLKINHNNPDKVLDTAEEINSDLERLNKIAQRFSKIGSKPELKRRNVYSTISKVLDYFERRLPQSRRNVMLSIKGNKEIESDLNTELFEWVIENLIKNALDAIESKTGRITIEIIESEKCVDIEVTDNGKGIDLRKRKEVFRPGYSTKRRGWGLGLSLSKRIIEEYHSGKIIVKNSIINEGTTFKISLMK
jgi:signal transduction histidine kinase